MFCKIFSNRYSVYYRLRNHLEPLTIAANVTQASPTRLDHVLLTFANLHRIFSRLQEEGSSGAGAVLASLEKRWGKTDQEAFILAVFYNPYIRDRLFSGEHTSLTKSGIFGMIRRMFERTFPGETRDVVSFSKAFNDYCDLQGDFSAESLDLDAIEQISEEQVYHPGICSIQALIYLRLSIGYPHGPSSHLAFRAASCRHPERPHAVYRPRHSVA